MRTALIAVYGPELGAESTAEALAYAWEHWPRVEGMENPAGYLYRVGRNWGRRTSLRGARMRVGFPPTSHDDPWVEPALPGALAGLSHRQRVAVLLVHGFSWTLAEVGELLGVTPSTVQRHVSRGLVKLRKALGVESGA
ncbi:MAG: sigma-70 family RNA polymerase sigma factor [Acidimicrobiia bacterium]